MSATAGEEAVEIDSELLAEILNEAKDLLDRCSGLLAEALPTGSLAKVDEFFRAFHTIKGITAMAGLAKISGLSHTIENGLARVRAGQLTTRAAHIELLAEGNDLLTSLVEAVLSEGKEPPLPPEANGYVERLCQQFELPREGLSPALQAALQPASRAPASLPSDASPATAPGEASKGQIGDFVRVSTQAVDQLLEAVGELLLLESRVRHTTLAFSRREISGASELRDLSTLFEVVARRVYEQVLSFRRTPAGEIFPRLQRVVRDAARKENKAVDLVMEGDTLLVDRSVLGVLVDPLIHMLRNSVSHGVEPTVDRASLRKPTPAKIRLVFQETDSDVEVHVIDDGRGIDPKRVGARALRLGLVSEAALSAMSEHDIQGFIFRPAFSTAEQVSELSGRGVGMDVVATSVREAGGNLSWESVVGRGTTFTLRVPKADIPVLDGLIVQSNDSHFLLPVQQVRHIFRAPANHVHALPEGPRTVAAEDGRYVALAALGAPYGATTEELLLVVLERPDGERLAITVDQVVGREQVLLCPLDSWLTTPPWLREAFILGSGQIGFVVDVAALQPAA